MKKRYEIQQVDFAWKIPDWEPVIMATFAQDDDLITLCKYGLKNNMLNDSMIRIYDNVSGKHIASWTATVIAKGDDPTGIVPEGML